MAKIIITKTKISNCLDCPHHDHHGSKWTCEHQQVLNERGYYWKVRVTGCFEDEKNPQIPNWCPLDNLDS